MPSITPVETVEDTGTTVVETVTEANPKPAKVSKPKVKAMKAKPKKEKPVVTKDKPAKKTAPKKDAVKLTFSQMMSTRLSNGELRGGHIAALKGLDKCGEASPMTKIVKNCKIGPRSVNPAIHFLVSEGLAKEQVSENLGKCYKITATGQKALTKAEK